MQYELADASNTQPYPMRQYHCPGASARSAWQPATCGTSGCRASKAALAQRSRRRIMASSSSSSSADSADSASGPGARHALMICARSTTPT